jgi:hypothetical protein
MLVAGQVLTAPPTAKILDRVVTVSHAADCTPEYIPPEVSTGSAARLTGPEVARLGRFTIGRDDIATLDLGRAAVHDVNAGTRKRPHPEEPPALDPLENDIRPKRSSLTSESAA